MMIRNCLIWLGCFILPSFAYAQKMDIKKLDLYFTALEENDKFMGSVAVSQNGKIIYSRAIGFSDVENKMKANVNSTYRVGSISKTFTAVLILKAIEEKKLGLDQTLKGFFPNIENAEKITIKHLLSHRSGIHNFTDEDDYLTWNTQPKTENEMVEIIAKGGSDFEPDSEAEYSNSNYVLLTYVLEKTFNQPYANILGKYITKPIHLKSTHWGGKIDTGNNESKSYKYTNGWDAATETDISVSLGAGGIVSSPKDLVKFSDALFNEKLLTKESLELMETIKDNYGLGLFQIPFYDKIGYGHRGGIDKFTSVFSYFPEGNISFALISNGTNYNNNEIPLAALSAVYNKPFDIPEFSVYAIDPKELDQYVGAYSSKQVPINIIVSKENQTLIAQATGQSPTPLQPTGKDKFNFDKTGIVLEFNPLENKMVLKQGGGEFTFTRE
jgi:D-alanyl-D-alanine carboxypeptidase